MPRSPIIVTARTAAERQAAYELRYLVRCVGARAGSVSSGDEVCDALDATGHIIVAWDKGQIVGTARIVFVEESPLDSETWEILGLLDPPRPAHRVSVTSRLAVASDHRESHLMRELMQRAFDLCRRRGVEFDVHLADPGDVPAFREIGYMSLGDPRHHAILGPIVPMAFPISQIGASHGGSSRVQLQQTVLVPIDEHLVG